ncbi:MAG TPA: CPBP family intramembrane glutamic endopeptidase [Holophagaceae bacterium]|nr:CPBP family intramembrane glutamic endopeptidase [Holophagaceae bacterium]
MRSILMNAGGRLRNGWWALLYVAVLVACMRGFQFLIPFLKRHNIHNGDWVIGLLFLFSLVATWVCTKLRKESVASVGFQLNGRWVREAGLGVLIGGGIMLLGAGMLWAAGGVTWELHPLRSLRMVGTGFLVYVLVALWEENAFRGFVFQRLVEGMGVWPTQLLLALLFGMAHWNNPGMHGATKFWATLDIALAALFLGLAYLRTRSLALPVGIHLGWNWVQGNVLGFGVSGTSEMHGWIRPVFQGKPEWVSGSAFGLEASIFGVVAVLIGIVLLWKWKGSAPAPASAARNSEPLQAESI